MGDGEVRVLLVEDNLGDARLVQEMLSESQGDQFRIHHADSLLTALDALTHTEFDVALLDLSLPDCHGMQTFASIHTHAPKLPVVVLTGLDSETMALDAVRSGVQDYLIKSGLSTDSLVRALEYAIIRHKKSAQQPGADALKTTVLGLLSSKGGVGTTTIACHFGRELRRQTDQKVLLMDVDVCSAQSSFLLKVHAPSTILDAATNLNRLDVEFWKGVVCAGPDGMDFVQAPGAVRFGDQVSGERTRHVLRFARSLYQWIVIDLGRLDATAMSLLQEVADLFVITTEEIPALYETKRVLKQLLEKGFGREQIRFVLNRAGRSGSNGRQGLENALGFPFYSILYESNDLQEAYTERRTLDGNLDLNKGIGKLVGKFLGTSPKESAPVGFNLFRLGARLVGSSRASET